MIIYTNKGFKKKYAYGGSGIFQNLANYITEKVTSTVTSDLAKDLVKDASSKILSAGKSAAKELGKQAIKSGKQATIEAATKAIEKGTTKLLTPKSQKAISKLGVSMEKSSPDTVSQKLNSIVSKYVEKGSDNINSLIDGSGVKAITIQDLARQLNGGGLKKIV